MELQAAVGAPACNTIPKTAKIHKIKGEKKSNNLAIKTCFCVIKGNEVGV